MGTGVPLIGSSVSPSTRSQNGYTVLLDEHSQSLTSPVVTVRDTPITLQAFGLVSNQTITVMSVYQKGNVEYVEPFLYLGVPLVLTRLNNVQKLGISGTYRLVYDGVIGGVVCVSIQQPQQVRLRIGSDKDVQPHGDQVNRPNTYFDEESTTNESQRVDILDTPWVFNAYGIPDGSTVTVYTVFGLGAEEVAEEYLFEGSPVTLTSAITSILLDKSGRYYFSYDGEIGEIVLVGTPMPISYDEPQLAAVVGPAGPPGTPGADADLNTLLTGFETPAYPPVPYFFGATNTLMEALEGIRAELDNFYDGMNGPGLPGQPGIMVMTGDGNIGSQLVTAIRDTALAATIDNGDITHAPTGDAVYDALRFTQADTGGQLRTLDARAKDIVVEADYDTIANARAAALVGPRPLLYTMGQFGGMGSTGEVDYAYRDIGAVLRQTTAGSGWGILNDGTPHVDGHRSYGISGVTETVGGDLQVNFATPSKGIGTIEVTVDEGFAAVGLLVGASVSSTYAQISFFAPLELQVNNLTPTWGNYMGGGLGNITLDTSTSASGYITVNHPSIVHTSSGGPAVLICKYDNTVQSTEYIDYTSTKTTTKIASMAPVCGKIVTNGAGAITVTHGLVTAPTAVWNSTLNRLEITHTGVASLFDATLTPGAGAYLPRLDTSGSTTTNVFLYDSAGVKYTGATAPANIAFWFRRDGTALCPWPSGTRIKIRRGWVPVKCQDVAGSSNNIWIAGKYAIS